jgi:hypothetical protein
MHASDPSGFANTVNPSLVDDWIGVEYDQYTVTGLPATQTTTIEVNWTFGYYAGLSLSPSAESLQTGQTETITATSLAQGIPVVGVPVRYTVTGANPSSGSSITGPTGAAPLVLAGANAGTDTVVAYVDANANNTFDQDTETQRQVAITWSAAPAPPATTPQPPPVGVSAAQIGAALDATLKEFRALLRSRAPRFLLRTPAPRADFDAPAAGSFTAALRTGQTTLASARVSFSAAGTKRVTLRPTKKGRRLLRRARRVKATLTLVFTPQAGGASVNRHGSVALKRRR